MGRLINTGDFKNILQTYNVFGVFREQILNIIDDAISCCPTAIDDIVRDVTIDQVLEIIDDADKKADNKTYIVLDDGYFYTQARYIKEKVLELKGGTGMKISEEMYKVKDLELKAGIFKELKEINQTLKTICYIKKALSNIKLTKEDMEAIYGSEE